MGDCVESSSSVNLLQQTNKLVAANPRFPLQYAHSSLSILTEVACKSGINRHIFQRVTINDHKVKNKYPPDNQNQSLMYGSFCLPFLVPSDAMQTNQELYIYDVWFIKDQLAHGLVRGIIVGDKPGMSD